MGNLCRGHPDKRIPHFEASCSCLKKKFHAKKKYVSDCIFKKFWDISWNFPAGFHHHIGLHHINIQLVIVKITFLEWPRSTGILVDIYIYLYIYIEILSGILSGILSDILSGILSEISSDIFPDILSGIFYGSLCGIHSDILSGILAGLCVSRCMFPNVIELANIGSIWWCHLPLSRLAALGLPVLSEPGCRWYLEHTKVQSQGCML